jgi:hypothetical protein
MLWAWLCWVSQIIWARRARVTSAVSALRDLRKTVSKYHPPARCQPVGDPGLPAQQVEPQFPDLSAEVSGVGLAEVLSVLGEQADEEVGPAEVAVGQAGQPGPDFRLDLDLIQLCHASDAICI